MAYSLRVLVCRSSLNSSSNIGLSLGRLFIVSVLNRTGMAFAMERFGSLAAVLNNLPPLEIYNMSFRDKLASSTHKESILIKHCYDVDTAV